MKKNSKMTLMYDETTHELKEGRVDKKGRIVGPLKTVDAYKQMGNKPLMVVHNSGPGPVRATLEGDETKPMEPETATFTTPCKVTVEMVGDQSARITARVFGKPQQ